MYESTGFWFLSPNVPWGKLPRLLQLILLTCKIQERDAIQVGRSICLHSLAFSWSLQFIRGFIYLMIMILSVDRLSCQVPFRGLDICVSLPPSSVTGKLYYSHSQMRKLSHSSSVAIFVGSESIGNGQAGVPSLTLAVYPSQICTDSWRWCFPPTKDGPSVKSLEVAVCDPQRKSPTSSQDQL